MTRAELEVYIKELVLNRLEDKGFEPRADRHHHLHDDSEQRPNIEDFAEAFSEVLAYLFASDESYYGNIVRTKVLHGKGTTDQFGRDTINFATALSTSEYGVSIVPIEERAYPSGTVYSPRLTSQTSEGFRFRIEVYHSFEDLEERHTIEYVWLVSYLG